MKRITVLVLNFFIINSISVILNCLVSSVEGGAKGIPKHVERGYVKSRGVKFRV